MVSCPSAIPMILSWPALTLVLLSSPAPQAGPWATKSISTSSDKVFAVAAGDFDGDGDEDVAAGGLGSGLEWFENRDGNGATWISRSIDVTAFPFAVEAADLDLDGDVDLVVGQASTAGVTWYENVGGDGELLWAPRTIEPQPVTVRSVAIADVDGDGDQDVLSALESDDLIVWHENLIGYGTSWARREIGSGDDPVSITVADLDADGDVDAVVAFATADIVAWYENTGDGLSWVREDIDLTADGAHWVHTADVDGDLDLDVIAALHNADSVAWYENSLGAAGWNEHRLPTTGGEFTSAEGADLDADGDVDILVAAFDGGDAPPDDPIVWLENLTGDAEQWREIAVPTNPGKVREAIAIDLDGDFDLDLLFASSEDDTVAWHQNRSFPDCNGNGVDDSIDLANGTSQDLDGDLVPDECARSYCTAKINSLGCVPYATAVGTASSTSPQPFYLTSALTLNNKVGLLFYGTQGATAVPFFGGLLCAVPPLVRMAPVASGGNATGIDCTGLYRFDFNLEIQAGGNAALIAGASVNVQFWSRDVAHPDGTGVGLSDAIAFDVLP